MGAEVAEVSSFNPAGGLAKCTVDMGVNEMRQFLVYGVVLEIVLDLSDHLLEGIGVLPCEVI